VRQEEFARFLDAAEAYILNYSTVGGDMPAMGEDDEEEEESSELDDENEETEDF
jgi:hypothetical protein